MFKQMYLVNAQALYGKPGYLKCIVGMNISSANKNLFTISLILYLQKITTNNGTFLRLN